MDDVSHVEIDTRLPKFACNRVTVTEIIRTLEVDYNDNFSKSVEPLKRELIRIFRVDSARRYSGKNEI